MQIINNFERTLIWLMDAYPESMYKLKSDIAKDILGDITENEKIIEDILLDNTQVSSNGRMEKIVSIYLFLADVRRKLTEIKGEIISFDDADYILQGMILANAEITQYFIEKAQEKDAFSYNNEYSQSGIMINYIKVIRDDMKRREKLQEFYPEENITRNRMLQIIAEYDWNVIETHIEYLTLINTLMCIQNSPFYSKKDTIIAEWFLDCFGEIFTNCRIEEMYMEPNIFYSEYEEGARTSTKMEIFFSQSNGDRYQLRLDFPHDDKNYIHFNLYEPFEEAAYPIDYNVYNDLVKNCGETIEDLFYHCGNRMWFKSNFKKRIASSLYLKVDEREKLIDLFDTHTHYLVCDKMVSENDMKSFLEELFSAISIMDMQHSLFFKPKNVDADKRLEYITLNHNVRTAAYKIDEANLYNLVQGSIPADLEEEINHINHSLSNVLTEFYAKYDKEELKELSVVDLLELVRMCMAENP